MLISTKYHFVFIHVYKNAGASVMNALLPFAASKMQYATCRVLNKFGIIPSFDPAPFPAHISAAALIEEIGKEAYDSLFSFAIVRNPWDWQVSLYTYMLKTKRHHQYNLAQTFGGFDGYIKWRCSEEVRLQKDFICSKNGDLLVNFVGKFENLEADFSTICSRIGVSASLPKMNISNTHPYQQYYTNETRELVRRTFHEDIATFGYEFE